MRLTPSEVRAIKLAARDTFGATASVCLFGSRVHDDLRGGDIDLLIEADATGETEWERTSRFRSALFRHIDEQKVDVVLIERGRDASVFARAAARDAIPLP